MNSAYKRMGRSRPAFLFLAFLGAIAISSLSSAKEGKRQSGEGKTEILWDTWGVPHIFAADEVSAFRAFGWAQMHNDGDVLLRLIAQGRGRGAEFYGLEYLNTDRIVHSLGLYETARAWYPQQNPQFRKDLDAFADGIDEYAQEHPDKLDAVSRSIVPVNGTDVLAHTIRVLTTFMSDSSSHVGSGCSVLGRILQDSKGSNGWAIGPAHSASGHAMLLANPHLPWDAGEYSLFEAQISAPSYNLYGVANLGFPVVVIGFNDNHGWTHTVNPIRTCDTYALASDGDQYKFDGQMHSFEVKHEVLKVKQSDGTLKEDPIEVRSSILGPVIEKNGKFIAIRLAGLQVGSYAGALDEWREMGRAKDFSQFQAALQRMQLPMLNVIYADRDGHIELLYNGLDSIRSDQQSQNGTLPGDSSALLWDKFYGYNDLPKAINPPSGWVQNSNSAPWYMTEPFLSPVQYPSNIAPQSAPSFREQRGLTMLEQSPKISYKQLQLDQYSTHCGLADLVLNDLVAAAKQSGDLLAQQAATVLEKWDRATNADSKGAYLFFTWTQKMKGNMFSVPFDIQHPLDTPHGLKDPDAAVTALLSAARELRQKTIPLDVPWGDIFHFYRGKFDFPSAGGPGEPLGIFDRIDYRLGDNGRFDAVVGDSFMAEVEFSSSLKAKVLLTYGNSTNLNSPHYGDQLAVFAKKGWREPWRTRAELADHIEERTILFSETAK